MEAISYKVPAANVDGLQEQIAEMNKRAAKLGVPVTVAPSIGSV